MQSLKDQGLNNKGSIVVLAREGLGEVRRIEVSEASVVRVLWHERINQILTGSSDGSLHVLYDPRLSTKGITIAAARAPRKRQQEDYFATAAGGAPQQIIAPHSLPMFKEDVNEGMANAKKRQRERERHDPKKTMKPSESPLHARSSTSPETTIADKRPSSPARSAPDARPRQGRPHRSRRHAARRPRHGSR